MVNEYSSSVEADENSLQMRMAFFEMESLTSITLTILATEENNNTLVFCKVSAKEDYMSNVAVLIVQGTDIAKLQNAMKW